MKDPMQTGILDYKDMLDAVKNLRDDESVKIGELDQLLSNSGSI